MLDVVREAVTEQDIRDIVIEAVKRAKRGDTQARRDILNYIVGPVPQDINLNSEVRFVWDLEQ